MQNRSFSEEWFDMLMLMDGGEGHKKYTQLYFRIRNVVSRKSLKDQGQGARPRFLERVQLQKFIGKEF